MHRFGRYQHGFSLAIIDLDNLKHINDTHGHLAGDQAIVQFAKLMEANKRKGDIFGRRRGDDGSRKRPIKKGSSRNLFLFIIIIYSTH
jgi:diguanylate cyclase (GGDEF)-like protein